MFTEIASSPSRTWTRVGGAIVLAFFCLPLFIDLGEQDLRNDEAIYSYSVDRMLETGDWLTPRAIPFDGPFLEKPPLKIWMVAGLMHAGLLPRDERGLRFVDALFGALAFLYVYLIGTRLAGPICGVVAVVVLFLFEPLLIDHGLRSNNMEAALLLAYCGGLYHFARWQTRAESSRGAPHAFAVGAYVALGFMTKFVAVLFLPLICALALLWQREPWTAVRSQWRAWIGPALLAVAICAPWFVYQWIHSGRLLWDVMLGQHIYTRFTASLDPEHLQPWTFYIVEIWKELARRFMHWIVAIGLVLLVARAWTGRPWLARLLVLWCVVPMVLISTGTSKLFHYAYPVLPALAIAAGDLVATVVTAAAAFLSVSAPHKGVPYGGKAVPYGGEGVPYGGPSRAAIPDGRGGAPLVVARRVLLGGAAIALVVGAWTAIEGRVAVDLGSVRFTNASMGRPIAIGAVLLWLGAVPIRSLHAWLVVPALALLTLPLYESAVERLRDADHPLRTIRDCAVGLQRSHTDAGRAVYNAARAETDHPYFYYLRHLGRWTYAEAPEPTDVRRHLAAAGPASPVIVARDDFDLVALAITADREPVRGVARASLPKPASREITIAGVISPTGVIIVLPGPYQACIAPAVAAGWRAVGERQPAAGDR